MMVVSWGTIVSWSTKVNWSSYFSNNWSSNNSFSNDSWSFVYNSIETIMWIGGIFNGTN